MKLLIVSDAHTQVRTWTNWPALKLDSYAALDKVQNIALTMLPLLSTPSALILPGDVLDGNRPSSEDLLAVQKLVRAFRHSFYITGNHDDAPIPFMTLFHTYDNGLTANGAHHLDLTPVTMDGALLYGIDYQRTTAEVLDHLAQIASSTQDRKNMYIVMHQGFDHLLGFESSAKIKTEDVVNILGPDVRIIVGHVHKRHTLRLPGGTGWIHSPGSIYPLDWDQAMSPSYASLIDTRTGEIEDLDVSVRRYVRLDGSVEGFDLKKALSAIPEPFEMPTAVRIDLPSTDKIHKSLKLSDYPDLRIQLRVGTGQRRTTAQGTEATVAGAIDMLHCILREIEETEPETHRELLTELAAQLNSSDDPKALVEAWLTEWAVVRS